MKTKERESRSGALSTLSDEIRTKVALATVQLPSMGGQGVLVPGGFILTAAHCITWDGRGAMTLGDHLIEAVRTKGGTGFRVQPLAAEPVADIAVLGELDNQVFGDDCDAFEEWREATEAVPISALRLNVNASLRVHILTHRGEWISGRVTRYGLPGSLPRGHMCIVPNDPIEGGTSGRPVIDDRGHLVGVVSWSTSSPQCDETKEWDGMIPVAHLALPAWVLAHIAMSEEGNA